MGKTLYVFSSAALKRKDNTLMLQTKNNGSSYIPVETVDEILIMGEAEINKSLIELLSEKGIVLHFLIISEDIQELTALLKIKTQAMCFYHRLLTG